MANFKYFADINGQTIELRATSIQGMKNAEFAEKFPGIKGRKSDGFEKYVGVALDAPQFSKDFLPVTRSIEYKQNPSKHVCNAKCLGGKANGVCECQCGGKNHGAGMFSRFAE